jgi:DNA-binding CsgD family transcriptional regulator
VLRPALGEVGDETPLYTDVFWLEVATSIGHRRAAERLAHRFAGCAAVTTGTRVPTCITRHLAAADALLGRPRAARDRYETALTQTAGLGFRPEAALVHLELADLLLTDFPQDREAATSHLEHAIAELTALDMQPARHRARALAARLTTTPASALTREPSAPDGLSAREVEVLRLIAAGKTNKEIADTLFISLNTVLRHVTHIFAKTGCANRAEAATFAARHGLSG